MKLTLKDFIRESTIIPDDITPEEAARIINEHGKEWKRIIGGFSSKRLNWIVYRGMRERFSPDIAMKYVRTSRTPMSTSKVFHDLADEYFHEKFGIKFRSNSIFVSRSQDLASYYGEVYAIFPLGRVHFAWSENSEDFTNEIRANALKLKFQSDSDELSKSKFIEFMDGLNYRVDDDSLSNVYLKHSDLKRHEVMINCDEYLAIQQNVLSKVLDLLDLD